MKSTVASLRSLTLPFGATTGQRIELDGITGEIRVYDTDGDLLIKIDGEFGFEVYDSNGVVRLALSSPFFGAYSAIEMWTAKPDETNRGVITLADLGSRKNRMVISPGQRSSKGNIEWTLQAGTADNTVPSMLQAVTISIDDPASPHPIIDLTGATADPVRAANQKIDTVVHDIFYGQAFTFGEYPDKFGSYPRGLVAFGSEVNDITLSTTVGTYVTVVATGQTRVIAGRRYKCMLGGGHSLITGGSGFAVGDAWEFQIERRVGAGVWDVLPGWPVTGRVRANVAAVARLIIPQQLGYYDPSADAGAVDFRVRATKVSGAATVTSVAGTNTGVSPFTLSVEDVGLQI